MIIHDVAVLCHFSKLIICHVEVSFHCEVVDIRLVVMKIVYVVLFCHVVEVFHHDEAIICFV